VARRVIMVSMSPNRRVGVTSASANAISAQLGRGVVRLRLGVAEVPNRLAHLVQAVEPPLDGGGPLAHSPGATVAAAFRGAGVIFVFGNGLSVGLDSRLATAAITQRVMAAVGSAYAGVLRDPRRAQHP
jgi:hypothetical protein